MRAALKCSSDNFNICVILVFKSAASLKSRISLVLGKTLIFYGTLDIMNIILCLFYGPYLNVVLQQAYTGTLLLGEGRTPLFTTDQDCKSMLPTQPLLYGERCFVTAGQRQKFRLLIQPPPPQVQSGGTLLLSGRDEVQTLHQASADTAGRMVTPQHEVGWKSGFSFSSADCSFALAFCWSSVTVIEHFSTLLGQPFASPLA